MENMHDLRTMPLTEVVALDEKFHETLVGLSGNGEILNALRSVNARIRPIRYLGVDEARMTLGEMQQREICIALRQRDVERLVELLTIHIYRSLPDVETAVRELYGRIYVG